MHNRFRHDDFSRELDRIKMPEHERAAVRMQMQRAAAMVDALLRAIETIRRGARRTRALVSLWRRQWKRAHVTP